MININRLSIEEIAKLKKGEWILDDPIMFYHNKIALWFESMKWIRRLGSILPDDELESFNKELSKIKKYDAPRLYNIVCSTYYNVTFAMRSLSGQKTDLVNKWAKKSVLEEHVKEPITLESLRRKANINKQIDSQEFIPTCEIMHNYEPIEVITEFNIVLTKYAAVHGLYVITIEYPGNLSNLNKVLYNKDVSKIEDKAVKFFDDEIEAIKTIANKLSPYSNTIPTNNTQPNVNIDHIRQVMGYTSNSPDILNDDDIF